MSGFEEFSRRDWLNIVASVSLDDTLLANRLRGALDDDRHIIEFRDDGWTILHPFGERAVATELFDCPFQWTGGDPGRRGRFWCTLSDDGQIFLGVAVTP